MPASTSSKEGKTPLPSHDLKAFNASSNLGYSASSLPASTQQILARVNSPSVGLDGSTGGPEWEAARQRVLESMTGSTSRNQPEPSVSQSLPPTKRGAPRGRPPLRGRRGVGSSAQSSGRAASKTSNTDISDAATSTPPTTVGTPDTAMLNANDKLSTPQRGRGSGYVGFGRGRKRGRGSGSRGSGKKRKRGGDDDEEEEDEDQSNHDSDSTSETSEKNPSFTFTKSGRQISKPMNFIKHPADSPSSAVNNPRGRGRGNLTIGSSRGRGRGGASASSAAASPSINGFGLMERLQADPAASIKCASCLRGHSPPHNQIVLCDGCETPFHQWCHDPTIPDSVVEIAESQWICAQCYGRWEDERIPIKTRVGAISEALTIDERKQYLDYVPSTSLRKILLQLSEQDPSLPIFPPATRAYLAQATMTHIDPYHPAHPTGPPNPSPPSSTTSEHLGLHTNDEYFDYKNKRGDPPATYPKPGHGQWPTINLATHPNAKYMTDEARGGSITHLVNHGAGKGLVREYGDKTKGNGVVGHVYSEEEKEDEQQTREEVVKLPEEEYEKKADMYDEAVTSLEKKKSEE